MVRGMPNLVGMQRLYAMFPQGGPGAGLMLLRGALAILVIAWEPPAWTALGPGLHLVLQIVLVAGLGLGVLTSGFCLLCGVAGVLALLPPQPQAWPWAPLVLADAFALAFLGPGAYSLDARLYGRRQVTLSSVRRPRRH